MFLFLKRERKRKEKKDIAKFEIKTEVYKCC